jgi:hypothetical protein
MMIKMWWVGQGKSICTSKVKSLQLIYSGKISGSHGGEYEDGSLVGYSVAMIR